MNQRVAITGLGAITPLGNTLPAFRAGLLEGRSGIGPLTRFPVGALESRIGGQCTIGPRAHKDIKVDFGCLAAASAIADADACGQSLLDYYQAEHCSLSLGVGLELFAMTDMVRYAANDYRIPQDAIGDPCFLQSPGELCAQVIMDTYGWRSLPTIHVSACAAATDAIGRAFLEIRRGRAGMILAGGTDSMLNPLGLAGFCKLQALSTNNDDPVGASRPFDLHRDGFVLGEGAGILVLENLEAARARGARIHGEIVGYGNAFDAYSVSDPHPEGLGAILAIDRALRTANLAPEDISYINAHGTSTTKNDRMETLAIKKVFGEQARNIPISSTKSMLGHLISAAGAVELIAAIICGREGMIHPTINLRHPDPDCDLDYVANHCRRQRVEYFLSNSFAFGGQNSALVCRLHNLAGNNDAL